jgi:hypothetical protein
MKIVINKMFIFVSFHFALLSSRSTISDGFAFNANFVSILSNYAKRLVGGHTKTTQKFN